MIKWVLVGLGVLIGLILAVVVVGYVLPREHVATRRARFGQTPDALFAVISGPPVWGAEVPTEVVESVPAKRMVTRIADPSLPYGGTWTFELIPDGAGTWLRITEMGEVRNPVFRFVSRFVMGHTKSIESYLGALAAKFGESIQIEE